MSTEPTIHLALPKGRMEKGVFNLLSAAGIELHVGQRGYRPVLSEPGFEVKLLKPQNIVGRGITFSLAAEIAGLCARWSQQPPDLGAAAAVVSSSLRSAYGLWLEDDDRAIATLRRTLEQTAGLRIWRVKPAKAATLEANSATAPRDELEGACWRR